MRFFGKGLRKCVIECKAVDKLIDIHELQLKNYLKATGIEVGLLLNFGRQLEIRRKFVSVSDFDPPDNRE